jgi:hypothetical protein
VRKNVTFTAAQWWYPNLRCEGLGAGDRVLPPGMQVHAHACLARDQGADDVHDGDARHPCLRNVTQPQVTFQTNTLQIAQDGQQTSGYCATYLLPDLNRSVHVLGLSGLRHRQQRARLPGQVRATYLLHKHPVTHQRNN